MPNYLMRLWTRLRKQHRSLLDHDEDVEQVRPFVVTTAPLASVPSGTVLRLQYHSWRVRIERQVKTDHVEIAVVQSLEGEQRARFRLPHTEVPWSASLLFAELRSCQAATAIHPSLMDTDWCLCQAIVSLAQHTTVRRHDALPSAIPLDLYWTPNKTTDEGDAACAN